MLALITKYLFRNEIATLKTIEENEYNKLTAEELKNNFIVLKSNKPLFISRGIYKTDKKYGIIKTKLDDKLINTIFKKHYEKMTDNIEINKNPDALEKLKQLGKDRGTSINVLLTTYFNNYKQK